MTIAPATPISASATRRHAAASMSARKCSKRSSPNYSGGLRFEDEVLEWVRDALHASHADERRENLEAIKRHQAEHNRLNDRIHAMYVDKLDGLVDMAFYDRGCRTGGARTRSLPAGDRTAPERR